jgi:hypothetical protein
MAMGITWEEGVELTPFHVGACVPVAQKGMSEALPGKVTPCRLTPTRKPLYVY